MAGETGAQDGANQERDKNIDWPGHLSDRTKRFIEAIEAKQASGVPLKREDLVELFKDQEGEGPQVELMAKFLADVPSMPASETTASGETSYPLLDVLTVRWSGGSLRAMVGKPGTQLEDHFSTGGPDLLTNPSRAQGMYLGGDAIRSMVPGPSKSMEEHFPAAGKSEQEAYEELVRIANTDVIKSVTDYKTGKLGELPPDETKWTKSQVDEIKVAAMLRGLANQDVIGDGPFAKMVGGVAKAARTVREGARSVGSKIGGLRDLAGRSSGGGEPPTTPPGGTPPAAGGGA